MGHHTESGMATLTVLDETLCKTPVCQHPQCWVTHRRLKQGQPRYRPLGSITRTPRTDPVGLPMLSITTLPTKPTLLGEPSVQGAASLVTFSQMSSPAIYNIYNSATCSMQKILFPGMNSYQDITAVPRRMTSNLSTWRPWKVATVDLCTQDLKTKDRTMVWVPNPQKKSQEQESRENRLKVHIKELTFADVCGQLRRKNQDSDVPKFRKANKPPTGGRPHNLILASSPILMQPHSRKWMTASSIKENSEKIMRINRRPNDYHPYSESQSDPGPDTLLLENRRMVLHDNRSKHRSSPSISHSGPLYKLDEQNLESLDDGGIDLNSIRNQYYLWKKYIGLAGPNLRIQPADSVVCDTERSQDIDSRNTLSSAGFSQTSWTEVEQSDAPADLDPGKISEQDILGEHAEEAESNQLQSGENTPQTLPDLESDRFHEEEESPKENKLSEIPQPIMESFEDTEDDNSSEQRAQSPQPNPPPPSPTHDSII